MIRRSLTALSAALMPFALLASEGAAEGHGAAAVDHGNPWMSPIWGVPMIVWQAVNLALVIGLFYYLLRKSAPAFFKGRVKEIQDQLSAALREKEEAEARLKEVESKMATLSEEVATIEREAVETAAREKERIRHEAEVARERIHKEAAEEVARQVDEAKRALRAEAAQLAEAAARELLSRKLTAEDDARLADRFFAQVGEKR